MNPYTRYYVNQVGTGLPGFSGIRFQKGHGWFGRLWSNTMLPFIKTFLPAVQAIGERALPSVAGLAGDIMSGQNVKQSSLSRFKEAGQNMGEEFGEQIKKRFQSGSGRKRKRKSKNIKPVKRIKRTRTKSYKKAKRNTKKRRLSFLE